MRISDWSSDVCSADLKTAGQRRVREQRIEVDRGVRDRDDMRARRDRAVEERQCLAVVERADLGHEAREEIERAITFGREAGKRAPPEIGRAYSRDRVCQYV